MADEHLPTREVVGEAPVDPLIAFVRARLDEREARAKAAGGASWSVGTEETPDGENAYYSVSAYGEREWFIDAGATEHELAKLEHIADNDPAFVLADVEAKRQILALVLDEDNGVIAADRSIECEWGCTSDLHEQLLKLLALPHAGHPDYREEFKP